MSNPNQKKQFHSWITRENPSPLIARFFLGMSANDFVDLSSTANEHPNSEKAWHFILSTLNDYFSRPDSCIKERRLTVTEVYTELLLPQINEANDRLKKSLTDTALILHENYIKIDESQRYDSSSHEIISLFPILIGSDAFSKWKALGYEYDKDSFSVLLCYAGNKDPKWMGSLRDALRTVDTSEEVWCFHLLQADNAMELSKQSIPLPVTSSIMRAIDCNMDFSSRDPRIRQIVLRYPNVRMWLDNDPGEDAQLFRACIHRPEFMPYPTLLLQVLEMGRSLDMSMRDILQQCSAQKLLAASKSAGIENIGNLLECF